MLGLASALAWGTADFLGGLLSRRLAALAVAFWSQVAGALGLVVLTLALAWEAPGLAAAGWGALGGAFSGLGLLLFYRALAIGSMSLVAPVSASGAAVPVAVAALRGEEPSLLALVGIAFGFAGVVLVSRAGGSGGASSGAQPRAAFRLAFGAAACFGLFYVFLDAGADAAGDASEIWVVDGARGGSLLVLAAIVARRRPPGIAGRGPVGLVALTGLLDTAANAFFVYGTVEGNLAVVSVLSAMFPVATVLLAFVVLRERLSRVQALGVVLALGGVTLIAAG